MGSSTAHNSEYTDSTHFLKLINYNNVVQNKIAMDGTEKHYKTIFHEWIDKISIKFFRGSLITIDWKDTNYH